MPIVTVPIDFDPIQYLVNYSDLQTLYSSISNVYKKKALLAKHYAEIGIKEFRSYYTDKHIPVVITNNNLYSTFKSAKIIGNNIAFDVPIGNQYFIPDTTTAAYTASSEYYETVNISFAQPTSINTTFNQITTTDVNININNTSNANHVVVLKGTGEDQIITLNYDKSSIGKSGSIGLLYYDSFLKNNIVFTPMLDVDFNNPLVLNSEIIYFIKNDLQLNTTIGSNTPWNNQKMYIKHNDLISRLDGTNVAALPTYVDLTTFVKLSKTVDFNILEHTASFNDNTSNNELRNLAVYDKWYVHINTTSRTIPTNSANISVTAAGTYNYDSHYYPETTLKANLATYISTNPPSTSTVIDPATSQTTITNYVINLINFDEYGVDLTNTLSLTYTSTCNIVVKYNPLTFEIAEIVSLTVMSGKSLTTRVILSAIHNKTEELYWGSVTFVDNAISGANVYFANLLINNDLIVDETLDANSNATYSITLNNLTRYVRELTVQVSRITNVTDVLHSNVSIQGYNVDTSTKSEIVALSMTGQDYKIKADYAKISGNLTNLNMGAKIEFI